MLPIIVAASSVLAAVLALALFREVQLRRALEVLLARILALWQRGRRDGDPPGDPPDHGDDVAGL